MLITTIIPLVLLLYSIHKKAYAVSVGLLLFIMFWTALDHNEYMDSRFKAEYEFVTANYSKYFYSTDAVDNLILKLNTEIRLARTLPRLSFSRIFLIPDCAAYEIIDVRMDANGE